jgi:hypothetical protein
MDFTGKVSCLMSLFGLLLGVCSVSFILTGSFLCTKEKGLLCEFDLVMNFVIENCYIIFFAKV